MTGRLIKYAVVVLILAAASYFVYQNISKSSSNEKDTVVVGYLPIYVDMPLFVAKEKGFFEKRGIKVDLKRFESSPDMGTGIVNGNLDAVASIATSVLLTNESRDPGKLKVFLADAPDTVNYLSSFVALKESGILSVDQLRGKKIGSFPGPTAVRFGKMVLEKFGLDPEKDVQWVELPAATHLSALEAKTVDALFTYEPTSTQAVLEKNAIKFLPGAIEKYIISPWHAGSWLVSKKFLEQNPALAKKFILAIYDAVDYMRNNPQQYKDALLPYTKIKIEVANKTPDIGFSKLNELDRQTYQKYANIHTEKNLISKKINASDLLLDSNIVK